MINLIVYDLEIEKAIPPRNPNYREDDIEYCKGWDDHANMGISVLCAMLPDGLVRVFTGGDAPSEWEDFLFCRNDIPDLFWAGFNNRRFDNRVLAVTWGAPQDEATVDLLDWMWRLDGLDPDDFQDSHKGYSLNDLLVANGLQGKSVHGSWAPIDWQRGKHSAVINHCMEDVIKTRQVFDLALAGKLRHPKNPDRILPSLRI